MTEPKKSSEQFLARYTRKAKYTRERVRKYPEYSCLVFPDANINPSLVFDVISQLDHVCQKVGGNVLFRVGLTDVLLNEHTHYRHARQYSTDAPTMRCIDMVREWQNEAELLCQKLDDAQQLKQQNKDFLSPHLELLNRAEKMITNEMAFLVGNNPQRFTGKPDYKNAKIPAVRRAIQILQQALNNHSSSEEIGSKATSVKNTIQSLSRSMYGVLPKTLIAWEDDPNLFYTYSGTGTMQSLEEAYARVILPQIRLRLLAYSLNKKYVHSPQEIVITPELRQAYSQACQHITYHHIDDMKGLETIGITKTQLAELRQRKPNLSYGRALLDRGFDKHQPVIVTLYIPQVTVQAEEIGNFIRNERWYGWISNRNFLLRKIGDAKSSQPCDYEQIKRYASGEELPPYGYEFVVLPHTRILPAHPKYFARDFDTVRESRSSIELIKLGDLDEWLQENNITQNVMSVDIAKNKVHKYEKEPEPRELPQNKAIDRLIQQRLFELVKEGQEMMPAFKQALFNHREIIRPPLAPNVKTAADVTDAYVTDEICYIPTYKDSMYDRHINPLMQVFFRTEPIKQYMASLPKKSGPYGSVKFNSGERSVREVMVIEKQQRVMVGDNYASAKAKYDLSGGKEAIPEHLAAAERTMATRDVHFFVSLDGGADERPTDAHIPMLALNSKEFCLLVGAMAELIQRSQRQPLMPDQKLVFDKLRNTLCAYQEKMKNNAPTDSEINALVTYYDSPASQRPNLLNAIRQSDLNLAELIERSDACDMQRLVESLKSKSPNIGSSLG